MNKTKKQPKIAMRLPEFVRAHMNEAFGLGNWEEKALTYGKPGRPSKEHKAMKEAIQEYHKQRHILHPHMWSPEEKELVVFLLRKGYSNQEIADATINHPNKNIRPRSKNAVAFRLYILGRGSVYNNF